VKYDGNKILVMKELKVEDIVSLKIGGSVKIKKKLGEGGQGIVYLVDLNGKDYALKWYTKPSGKEFYNNLENNIQKGAPTSSFLWPLYLTEMKDGHFGYLMELRPAEFAELSDFLIAKVRFGSVSAMINAALCISNGFRHLHHDGYSYQDLNDGNFFINPQTGDVLICDNDNVAPYGKHLGIAGKSRYMAPEVVRGDINPNADTDRFSLAVILFMLFYNNHPLEGKAVVSVPCMTERNERIFYGESPIFIYDPLNDKNRPVQGIHTNVIRRWNIFPSFITDSFIKAFSNEFMMNPSNRNGENFWQKIFVRLRDVTVKCSCGGETFIDPEKTDNKCMNCGKSLGQPLTLKTDSGRLVLFPGMKAYICHTKSASDDYKLITGEVIQNKNNPLIWGLRNLTQESWIATMPGGISKSILSNEVIPIYKDVSIVFNGGKRGDII
jgi:serine/threonine protein kinase